ncbi:MAG: hypothetical protein JNM75_06170 [Rhodospirillales bacterium]|nr:hypothetical protein [Rhodospirillales bacterium]
MGTYTGTSGSDTIRPGFVSAGVTANPLHSTPSAAADVINGMGGKDDLDGGGSGDAINGGGGDDFVRGSGSGNTLHGNAGNDWLYVGQDNSGGPNPANNVLWGDDGNDRIGIGYGSDRYEGDPFTGTSVLHGGAGDDLLSISAGSEESIVDVHATKAFLYGEDGNDTLKATARDDFGDGTYSGTDNFDTLTGGKGDDTYLVFEQKDVVVEKAGEGYDVLEARGTDYSLPANVEKLVLSFNWWLNWPVPTIHGTGNALDNIIVGSERNEVLDGLAGNDTIYGKAARAFDVTGYPDNDVIHGGAGNDLIYGAGGDRDTWDGADTLYGDAGNDRIFGQFGDDHLYGGDGNDSLSGQEGNDVLLGGLGNDHLGGGTGDDWLYGSGGADVLTGRQGLDRLYGEGGHDRFVYEAVSDSLPGDGVRDIIIGFRPVGPAKGDVIDLSAIDANTTKAGNQAFVFKGEGGLTGPGQLHVMAHGSDTLIQGEVDGKAGADFEILVTYITAHASDWAAGDFIL